MRTELSMRALVFVALSNLITGCLGPGMSIADQASSPSNPVNPSNPPISSATYPTTPFTETELLAGQAFANMGSIGSADGIPGKFQMPTGIAIDANYAYISDTGNNTIRRVNRSTGSVQTIAGSASASGTANGNGAAARFEWPMEIHLDGSTLYISDSYNYCIRAIDVSNVLFPVTTVAGLCGTQGFTDGIGTAARFNEPGAIVKVGGNLYIADAENHTIRKIQLSNMQVSTVAGTVGSAGFADGTGTSAKFRHPRGLTAYLDAIDGYVLFIADRDNHVIRRMVLATDVVATVAGSAGVLGFVDGSSAKFSSPWALANDGTSIYVSDSANNAIRKIRISDYEVATIFGSPSSTGDVFGPLVSTQAYAPYGLHFDGDAGLLGLTQSALFRIK